MTADTDLIEMYKPIARRHDTITEKLVRKARHAALIKLSISKNSNILDLGCGSGDMMYELMSRYKKHKLCFTGVDLSPHMIRKAKKKLKEAKKNGHHISLVCRDCIEHLETCGEYEYDLVSAAFLLSYVDSSELFPLVNTALKKGGKFVILTPSDNHLKNLEKVFFKFVMLYPSLSNWGSIPKIILNKTFSRTLPLEKTLKLLHEARFSKVKSRRKPIMSHVRFDDPVSFLRWMYKSVWAVRYSNIIREDTKETFFNVLKRIM